MIDPILLLFTMPLVVGATIYVLLTWGGDE